MFIQISTNNYCQLKCEFCVRDRDIPETMTYDNFTYIIDEFCDTYGKIRLVDMTPIVGEFTLTPRWLEMLTYLYEKPEIDKFDFVTNFVDIKESDIKELLDMSDKFSMIISVYGHDRSSFMKTTNIDRFDDFQKNLLMLLDCVKNNEYKCFPLTFYMRHIDFNDMPRHNIIWQVIKALQISSSRKVTIDSSMACKNHNWAEQVTGIPNVINIPVVTEPCVHSVLQNCVLPNGDITICGMNDIYGKMIIGNIFESPLSHIYSKGGLYDMYMKQYHPMCFVCTEYEAKSSEARNVKTHEDRIEQNRQV